MRTFDIDYSNTIDVECRLIEEPPTAEDLLRGQRQLREFEDNFRELIRLTKAPQVTTRDIVQMCLWYNGSGIHPDVCRALLRDSKLSLRHQRPDSSGNELIITIDASTEMWGETFSVKGTVYGVSLPFYTHTRIPDQGLALAERIKDKADALIVVDPLHANWNFERRQVPRDPWLLAACFQPYKTPAKATPAVFALLCQW